MTKRTSKSPCNFNNEDDAHRSMTYFPTSWLFSRRKMLIHTKKLSPLLLFLTPFFSFYSSLWALFRAPKLSQKNVISWGKFLDKIFCPWRNKFRCVKAGGCYRRCRRCCCCPANFNKAGRQPSDASSFIFYTFFNILFIFFHVRKKQGTALS